MEWTRFPAIQLNMIHKSRIRIQCLTGQLITTPFPREQMVVLKFARLCVLEKLLYRFNEGLETINVPMNTEHFFFLNEFKRQHVYSFRIG